MHVSSLSASLLQWYLAPFRRFVENAEEAAAVRAAQV